MSAKLKAVVFLFCLSSLSLFAANYTVYCPAYPVFANPDTPEGHFAGGPHFVCNTAGTVSFVSISGQFYADNYGVACDCFVTKSSGGVVSYVGWSVPNQGATSFSVLAGDVLSFCAHGLNARDSSVMYTFSFTGEGSLESSGWHCTAVCTPAAGGSIQPGTGDYPYGAPGTTFNAVANPGYIFSGWNCPELGISGASSNPQTIQIEESTGITAITLEAVFTNIDPNGNGVDNDDDVPAINDLKNQLHNDNLQIIQKLSDIADTNYAQLNVQIDIYNRLGDIQTNQETQIGQLDQIIDKLDDINIKLGSGGGGASPSGEPGAVDFPQVNDETPEDFSADHVKGLPFFDRVTSEIEGLQNSVPGPGLDWKMPFSLLHPSMTDFVFNFTGSHQFLVDIRLMLRGLALCLLYIGGFIQWFRIVAGVFDV